MTHLFTLCIFDFCFTAMNKEICQSPFFLAAVKGNVEEIKNHYEATSADTNKKDKFYFALYFACFNGQVDVVKFLLENKVDPNYVVGSYLTPLHAAIMNEHNSITEWLLNHGANVNPKIKNKSGYVNFYSFYLRKECFRNKIHSINNSPSLLKLIHF